MDNRWVRMLLLIVGIACTVVFFSVNGQQRLTPDGDSSSRWVIGFNLSPWFVYERSPRGLDAGVQLISASWLFAAAAVGAFWLRKRTARPGSPAPPNEERSHAAPGAARDRGGR
jgi:hypothetical protein